ncbi:MAG: ATP-dependent DNA helicase [Saprospiraceae bacterium]
MLDHQRFDFQDMILWVIEKFKTNPDLLAKYQERYQYILVDEYQDTNGSQNELLFLLIDFWDNPNVFIVGDDDQSIFRFQGANMNSIIHFKEKYHPLEIVLTENYRSSQKILDRAKILIEYNQERLVNKYPYLIKDITESRAKRSFEASEPEINEYINEAQEESGIIQKIDELHRLGVDYREIAIIYTRHNTVDNLVRYYSQKKIPINVKKKVNVLNEYEVIKIIKILEYLHAEFTKPHSGDYLMFEILHFDCFEISALDVAALSIFCSKKEETSTDTDKYEKWRNVVSNRNKLSQAEVSDVQKILKVAQIIEGWISAIANVTIQTLIEKVLTESNMLHNILSDPDKSWKLQVVNTFFDYIKTEGAKRKGLSLQDVVSMISLMIETNIELPIYKLITNTNGINFLTAYAAKGLEFEHVFIMRCNKNMWESKQSGHNEYSISPNITSSIPAPDDNDDRRLFYVAMTRAKDFLYISYVAQDEKDKPVPVSKFVAEVMPEGEQSQKIDVDPTLVFDYKAELMKYEKGEAVLIDGPLVDRLLQNFKMSSTSLNKYLRCRLTFYFETILRVPKGRSATMGFGNAVHYALEMFFKDLQASSPRSMASAGKLIELFEKGMDKYKSHFTAQEYNNYTTHGQKILREYYDEYSSSWLAIPAFELEYNIPSVEYQGVPISGKLDRVNIYSDHISVTDYKTGKYDSKKLSGPKSEEDTGGDYWRQIVFYKLLLDSDKRNSWVMKSGFMNFIEKDKTSGKYKNEVINVEPFEMEIVGKQLTDAYQEIKQHIFMPGCGDKECQWCNFVLKNMPVSGLDEMSEEEDLHNEPFVGSA